MKKTHGRWRDKVYGVWTSMRGRCNNPTHEAYVNYGGRGITVCPEWDDFTVFIKDMGERPDGLTLERIDNNQGYSPDNCKWATRKEQMTNCRANHNLTFAGRTQNIAQWQEELGFKNTLLNSRLRRGWSVERALTTPTGKYG